MKADAAGLRQAQHVFSIDTHGQGLVEITPTLRAFLSPLGFASGLLSVFCRHTSASLLIQENADPAVQRDLARFFARIAPEDFGWEHDEEGADDMPAHVRAALTQTSLSIPIVDGAPALGTWQGVYLFEHRRARHRRQIVLHAIGA